MNPLQQQLETAITEFWDELTLADAAMSASDPVFPEEMDSLTAVDALLRLETIVGMELEPYQVIRRGGYDNKEQFVKDLTEKVLNYVQKAQAGASA